MLGTCSGVIELSRTCRSPANAGLPETLVGRGELGALAGNLVFHARRILLIAGAVRRGHGEGGLIAILGGASGVLAASGDDGVDGIGLADTAVFVPGAACGRASCG
jgi:hypothetical protein